MRDQFEINDGNVQILPNAKYSVQNFYGIDYAKHVLSSRNCSKEVIPAGVIADMYYYSETRPCPVANEIYRASELALCEKRLENDSILCLYGDDGVGVTTLLAQFAKQHGVNCVSYFYDGLNIVLMDAEVMEVSVAQQLHRLVLSLAADTKERIDRVDSLISSHSFAEEGYIQIGDEEKARAHIFNWYQSCNFNTLTIIDPYFKPQDLTIVKQLCDINNSLEIRILSHRQKFTNEDYLSAWKNISSGVINNISLNFVWYEDKSTDGPLHDRYWICSDEENDEHKGITLCSIDSLGKKESSITDIGLGIVMEVLHSYSKYVYTKIKRIGGRILAYDSMELD